MDEENKYIETMTIGELKKELKHFNLNTKRKKKTPYKKG